MKKITSRKENYPRSGIPARVLLTQKTCSARPEGRLDGSRAGGYNVLESSISCSSAPLSVQAPGRIENRVRIPDGPAAVCAEVPRFTMKIGHWETGKAARDRRRRESEELLEQSDVPPAKYGPGWVFCAEKRPRRENAAAFFASFGPREK